jgi:hypothetical protein
MLGVVGRRQLDRFEARDGADLIGDQRVDRG